MICKHNKFKFYIVNIVIRELVLYCLSPHVSSPVFAFGHSCVTHEQTQALVGFCILCLELEKVRHTCRQDRAINPLFKCDECSYMAVSRTVLKHPNKEDVVVVTAFLRDAFIIAVGGL